MSREIKLPEAIEKDLDHFMAEPDANVLSTVEKSEGDFVVLGAAGKMGPTVALMLRKAIDKLGKKQEVYGVSRFSDPKSREQLEAWGIKTVPCDLLDAGAVKNLPDAKNVLFLAGQKFGTSSNPELTWVMNTLTPANVAERYKDARIVAYSTGCVYPFTKIGSGGSVETDEIDPQGEYANTCAGRERVFEYYAKKNNTPIALYRLNYAVDLRYGVIVDVAQKVLAGEEVDVSMGQVNLIWQGDAVARSIALLDHATSPAFKLNVTGPETIAIRFLAEKLAGYFGKTAKITGTEQPEAWLSNASLSNRLFGYPQVTLDEMIQWVAAYLQTGGSTLNKPTHFETRDGKF